MKITRLSLFASLFLTAGNLHAAPHAEHVVVIVWDGMRPDFVTAENAPTLTALAHDGVFFRNNHSLFPTSTNVNGAVFATGDYPGHNGIVSNQEFRPEIDPLQHFDIADSPGLNAIDPQVNAKLICVPTVAEIVQKAGYRTAVAGSNDQPNEFGARGEVASDIGKGLGQGTHSTFSRHSLHNTLIASGPDFRHGWKDETATGNIDVVATVLHLLAHAAGEDGRPGSNRSAQ